MYRKGFVHVPILLAIILGITVVGVGGYVSIKFKDRYQKNTSVGKYEEKIAELEKKLVEIEKSETAQYLKEQQIKSLKGELTIAKRQNEQIAIKPKQLSNSEIINKVSPSVVYIEVEDGYGSGFIISNEGLILSNAHVVEDETTAKVILGDKRVFIATVVGRDEKLDVALLKINQKDLPKLTLGDSNESVLKQGDEIFTFGFPLVGEKGISFKEGTVSRRLEDKYATYIEVSAEIHSGNSGGPLVNRYGDVVGINTAKIYEAFVKGIGLGESIKLAIPINDIKNILVDLETGRNILLPRNKSEAKISESAVKPRIISLSMYRNTRLSRLGMTVQSDTPILFIVDFEYKGEIDSGLGGKRMEYRRHTWGEQDLRLDNPYTMEIFLPRHGPTAELSYTLIVKDQYGNINKVSGTTKIDSIPELVPNN